MSRHSQVITKASFNIRVVEQFAEIVSTAFNMLRQEPSAASKSIVEASSGSTVLSLAMAARALYGNDNVCAYVTNKKQPDQLRLLRLFGLKV